MLRLNPNHLLRLGIRSKLLIAFLALSTVPLLLSGLYALHVHSESLEHAELSHLEHDVITVRERTATFLAGVEGDLRFLSESRLFRRFVDEPDPSLGPVLLDQVVDFASSKGIYYQIRYLDWSRGERLAVRARQGRYVVLEPDPEAPVEFYRHLLDREQGTSAFAAVELSASGRDVVAAISYARPILGTDGESKGALVMDVFASYLFAIVEGAHENTGGGVALVDGAGHYLYHSEFKSDWGRLLANREEQNVGRDYPRLATQIMAGTAGVLTTETEVIAHAPIMQSTSGASLYTLFMTAPRDLVLGSVLHFQDVFFGTLVAFTLLSVVLAFLAARQFTRPVNALQEGARVIAGGQYDRRLHVETYDEIQQLSESFNVMAAALEDRETRLRRHEAELAATVRERTQELAEEKAKVEAILDAVPSAFVLLDAQLRVLSASRAFERICGHAPQAVVGQPYRALCDCDPGEDFLAEIALRSGRVEARLESVTVAGGGRRQVERVDIPLVVDGQVHQVIEMLTDVTERKEMEARILQSEKLATTGEMAALIAHEMRNSLTSVKMILQLQLERSGLPAADREALGVADGAVRRMESVVTDLLKFARPSPPELRPVAIAAILEDSLSLIRHQLSRRRVSLELDIAPSTPAVLADGDQLKEVFVNLLLNAAQAAPEGGQVRVASRAEAGGWIVVEVADDGPGIPEAQRERIFDPFFTTKVDGTGLGLSTARRTVEAHGGRIVAGGRAGAGALFTLSLPAQEGAAP